MPSVLRTSFDVILPLLLARLQSVTGLGEAACFSSQMESAEVPYDGVADRYCWLRLGPVTVDDAVYEGAGRVDTRLGQVIEVTARTRLGLDTPTTDLQWLVQAHLPLVNQVYDALVTFTVVDASGNVLDVHPVKPLGGTAPRRDKKQREWGESVHKFLVPYEFAADQSVQ